MLLTINRNLLTEEDLVLLPKHETISVTHTNLATVYDFASAGTGTFTFTPTAIFQVAHAASHVDEVSDTITVIPTIDLPQVDVTITEDVQKRHLERKRIVVECAVEEYAEFIQAAYEESNELARLAYAYIDLYGASDPFYQSYFGNAPTEYPMTVLALVATENSTTSRTVDCSDPYAGCEPGVVAYTLVSTTDIYYCQRAFQDQPTADLCNLGLGYEDRFARGGTMLHELTHATSGTYDHTYGCDEDRQLAIYDWRYAVSNADNYNCFSTQIYEAACGTYKK